ncbi:MULTISPECIES: ABC transporter permease [Marichromatium]|uniref:Transport permease protein n=1 Tax=Marichromatium gracile TaxID=1048 RepID=A0ABR5VD64_MARGR|nr:MULTISPECIES: ABC transporter permease [Marichromatium]KXX63329.1 ABC transporter [Marichromatium gracile]MBO8084811.1 ABC transporter permease [Marichromatium sp.]RNE90214.1 ABC transporter permease [Marichromatium sp. AB31]RNE93286.1 ABC transporter permease [Marichromatium sp. AB32]
MSETAGQPGAQARVSVWRELYAYRELMLTLAWKNVIVRYKQAYLGLVWAVLKPLLLMLIFSVVKGFVGIETGGIPYPVLAFAALMPWILFQESASEGVNSVVGNAALIRKIYFPREIFPITATLTKLIELLISFAILAALMAYYQMAPTWQVLWVPLIIAYTLLAALIISLVGSAINVYYRDIGVALPVLLQIAMYLSPVIYPLSLVKQRLLEDQAAGAWSDWLYLIYTLNPLAGIIDAFQRTMLHGQAPDLASLWPGMLLTALLLPLSYRLFKRAESRFADVI